MNQFKNIMLLRLCSIESGRSFYCSILIFVVHYSVRFCITWVISSGTFVCKTEVCYFRTKEAYAVIIEEWQVDLAEEIRNKPWTGVYKVAESSRERREEEFSSRTYVYENNGSHYKQTWHDNCVGSPWQGFSTERYWGSPEQISRAEYDKLRQGKTQIDTDKNRQNVAVQKQKIAARKQQEVLERKRRDARRPKCPRCTSKMVERKNGTTGKPFWGCENYPNCKGTRNRRK